MVKIIWSNQAIYDFKEILDYISRDSYEYAAVFSEKLLSKTKNLSNFPNMGRMVPESDDPNDKELIFKNFRIIYQVKEKSVEIITIIHGSRQLRMKK